MRGRVIHDQFSTRHPVVITSAISDFSKKPLFIPIDSTLEDFVIKISTVGLETETLASVDLTSPSNMTHPFKTTLQNGSVTYIQVQAPESGIWRLQMSANGDSPYSATVLGISTWDAILNVMVLQEQMRHVKRIGMRTVKADEQLDQGSTLFVYVMTPVESASITQLDLRGTDGILIKHVPVTSPLTVEDGFSRYLFDVTIPEEPFRFVVRAKDDKGFDVVRASETVYNPVPPLQTGNESGSSEGEKEKGTIEI